MVERERTRETDGDREKYQDSEKRCLIKTENDRDREISLFCEKRWVFNQCLRSLNDFMIVCMPPFNLDIVALAGSLCGIWWREREDKRDRLRQTETERNIMIL